MSEYTANMELVQDKPVQDDAHVALVLKTGNAAAVSLSAYKDRSGEKPKTYGTGMWWALAAGVAALAVCLLKKVGAL